MKTLTPEKAGRELARVMEQVRREREELADATKERKGHIAALEKRARELVDIANGRAHVQLEADLGEELCGACGKPGNQPSKGCDECDHGKPTKKDRPRFTKKWHPEWTKEGKPAHAPLKEEDGGCPVLGEGKDWRECATCVAAVSGEVRPYSGAVRP